jgi:1-acyl-sn-glycerol-3-phosphate acyltransferase
VSNHVGYLDSLVLAAYLPARFLAKSEISRWPVLGIIARCGGALFVERERPRSAAALVDAVAERLSAGDRILLFPEAGVSPDGLTLAEFRPMLFQSCILSGRPVVPAALRYLEPPDTGTWAWFDNSNLWYHLWTRVLPAPVIRVELRVGEVLPAREGEGRKGLAARTREAVRRLLAGED